MRVEFHKDFSIKLRRKALSLVVAPILTKWRMKEPSADGRKKKLPPILQKFQVVTSSNMTSVHCHESEPNESTKKEYTCESRVQSTTKGFKMSCSVW